tara:strand:- start:741 stop:1088 length:348 start_codon:yes stop_codon:yes gene_type:complete
MNLDQLRPFIKRKLYKTKLSSRRKPGFEKLQNNIDLDYLEGIFPKDGCCPVFGFKLDHESANVDLRPSIDRIDPYAGYEKGNVIWVSYLANRMKSDLSLQELIKIGKWAKKELTK